MENNDLNPKFTKEEIEWWEEFRRENPIYGKIEYLSKEEIIKKYDHHMNKNDIYDISDMD